MTALSTRAAMAALAIYYADDVFRAGVETLRRAAGAVCPHTGQPDPGALILALGEHFDVWSAEIAHGDRQAEVGLVQLPAAFPAGWAA